MLDTLLINIGQLLTMDHGEKPLKGEAMGRLPLIENGAVGIKDGRFAFVGSMEEAKQLKAEKVVDCMGRIVSPGLIDPHTHVVFGGSREHEISLKLQGVPYLEILKRGGGIYSTVQATKQLGVEELKRKAKGHLDRMLSYGVTTAEAKSGYGLDRKTEWKQLQVIQMLQQEHPIDLVPTFLGAHALPKEYEGNAAAFLQSMIQILPELKGMAEFVDIFCETGVFTVEEAKAYLQKAKQFGFHVKMHADEIHSIGGTEAAVELGAVSADHLCGASEKGIEMLAASDTIAVLLPGTTFYLNKDRYAKARSLITAGAAVALATDFNPGSCPTENIQLIMSLALLKLKMTPEEIWNAVTVNAAHAIHRGSSAGQIQVGRFADAVLWDAHHYAYIPYHFGVNHAGTVWKHGKVVYQRGEEACAFHT